MQKFNTFQTYDKLSKSDIQNAGPDNMPIDLLQDFAVTLSEQVCFIFNMSLKWSSKTMNRHNIIPIVKEQPS